MLVRGPASVPFDTSDFPPIVGLFALSAGGIGVNNGANTLTLSTKTTLGFVASPLDYGCVANDAVDCSPAFAAAATALNTGAAVTGGTILIPRGIYKLNEGLKPTTTESSGTASLIYQGDGQSNTILDFSGMASGDGIAVSGLFGVKFRDLKLSGAKAANIHISGSGFVELSHIRSQGATTDGVKVDNGSIVVDMDDVFSVSNGNCGFNLGNKSTTITARATYAESNSFVGYCIDDLAYSTFISPASDLNGRGYSVQNVRGVTFISPGAESNLFEGWTIQAESTIIAGRNYPNVSGLSIISPYTYNNSTGSGAGYNFAVINAFDESISMTISEATDKLGAGVSNSLHASAASTIIEIDDRLSGATLYDGGAVQIPIGGSAGVACP